MSQRHLGDSEFYIANNGKGKSKRRICLDNDSQLMTACSFPVVVVENLPHLGHEGDLYHNLFKEQILQKQDGQCLLEIQSTMFASL